MEDEDYKNMNDSQLLKLLAKTAKEYDLLRDRELNVIELHPDRDLWSDDLVTEYEELCEDICITRNSLLNMTDYILNK